MNPYFNTLLTQFFQAPNETRKRVHLTKLCEFTLQQVRKNPEWFQEHHQEESILKQLLNSDCRLYNICFYQEVLGFTPEPLIFSRNSLIT